MAVYTPISAIEVSIWGMEVGALAADPLSGYFAFEYSPSFRKTGIELSPLLLPLSSSGPVVSRDLPAATFRRLPAFVADSLPDKFGNQLIDAWASRNGVSLGDFTALDRLAYVGGRAMGALEFQPAIRQEREAASAIELKELVEGGRKALSLSAGELADENAAGVMQLMRIGTSAGGAKAKAVVGYNPASGSIISGQLEMPEGYEPWLVKLDTGNKPYGCIEYAYYLMALDCGIDMAESRLIEAAGKRHFMTRRFDRTVNGEKVHVQTLCAMAGMDFNQLGTHDYLQLFDVLDRLELGHAAADQAFTRMVFNVCMANNDDHPKNHSFLLERNKGWRLAPAYDMMFACNPANKWTARHAMGVNGAFTDIGRADIEAVAKRCNVKEASACIERVVGVARNWKDYAEKAGVDEATASEVDIVIQGCCKLVDAS